MLRRARRDDRLRAALAPGEPAVAATAETLAKLRHDVVARLVAHGRLQRVHGDAAEEIRTVSEAVGRGLCPTAQMAAWAGRPSGFRGPRDFLDRMTAEERRLWQFRYLPWRSELVRAGDDALPGARWLGLVLDIVVDNSGLRQAERRQGLRHGTALTLLAIGLERYDRWRR
jgi:hypothetical protein